MDVVRAAVRIGARALALARQQIDPALLERALNRRAILGPERRHGVEHDLLRFLGRVIELHRSDERRVEIVVVQLRQAENPLPQLQVPVERRQIAVHAVDEPRIDGDRNVRAVERRLERRRVAPRLREEQHLLHFPVHRGAEGPAEAAERGEERRHHLLAIAAIGQRAQIVECRLIELDRAPVAQRDRRIWKIGVRQDAEGVRGRRRHRPRIGEQPLVGGVERVRRAPRDVLEVEAVHLQARLRGSQPIERRLPRAEQLRLDECRLRAERRRELRHLLPHPLALAVARVLVGEHARVRVEPRELLVERRLAIERVGERRRRRRELALEPLQRRELGGELVLRGAPRHVARVDLGEIPRVLLGNFRAVALLRERGRRTDGSEDDDERPFHRVILSEAFDMQWKHAWGPGYRSIGENMRSTSSSTSSKAFIPK